MIENKKLFMIVLSFVLVIAAFELPCILLVPNIQKMGWFYIASSILALTFYTLLYRSLKKTALIKKIYLFIVVLAITIFLIGIAIYAFNF